MIDAEGIRQSMTLSAYVLGAFAAGALAAYFALAGPRPQR